MNLAGLSVLLAARISAAAGGAVDHKGRPVPLGRIHLPTTRSSN
jgi:hypothetical protein